MPWCPQCKEEYKEGITVCPDCKVPLVGSLEQLKEEFIPVFSFEKKEMADKFSQYLIYSGIECRLSEDDENTGILIREKDLKRAKKHFQAFYSVEAQNAFLDELKDLKEAGDRPVFDPLDWAKDDKIDEGEILTADSFKTADEELKESFEEMDPSEPYEKRSDKASDTFSTAILFLAFGAIGIIIVLLNILKIFSFMNGTFFYIFAMIMFLGFIAVGVFSLKSYKKLKGEAAEEEAVTKALNEWLAANFTKEDAEQIGEDLKKRNPETTEAEIYYVIRGKLKAMLTKQFGELDEAYLEYITEDFYNSLGLDNEEDVLEGFEVLEDDDENEN